MPELSVRVSISLRPDVLELLDKRAAFERSDRSGMVRQLIVEYERRHPYSQSNDFDTLADAVLADMPWMVPVLEQLPLRGALLALRQLSYDPAIGREFRPGVEDNGFRGMKIEQWCAA